MIIERNEFRLKFGKAKEAIAIWKSILEVFKEQKDAPKMRLMTDISGPSYTIILEMHLLNFIDIGLKHYQWLTSEKAAQLYQQFVPLCESAHRTLYNIEMEM